MVDTWMYVRLVLQDSSVFDITPYINRDSIKVGSPIRQSRVITTLDGKDHVTSNCTRQTVSFTFNPLRADFALDIAYLLTQSSVIRVLFKSLVNTGGDNSDGSYNMMLSDVTAEYLSRCRFGGVTHYQFDEIELVQL